MRLAKFPPATGMVVFAATATVCACGGGTRGGLLFGSDAESASDDGAGGSPSGSSGNSSSGAGLNGDDGAAQSELGGASNGGGCAAICGGCCDANGDCEVCTDDSACGAQGPHASTAARPAKPARAGCARAHRDRRAEGRPDRRAGARRAPARVSGGVMAAALEVRDLRAAARDSAGGMVAVQEAPGPGAQAVLGSAAISETATRRGARGHSISNEQSLRFGPIEPCRPVCPPFRRPRYFFTRTGLARGGTT
jgi:hypothetical protein